mmetsp:Transcript_6724/g.17444  ORF Transcript_6724/g.17444 Transcript_6724/m.17444 type:complete len:308 (+) Transcript_6724:1179-2102(+)
MCHVVKFLLVRAHERCRWPAVDDDNLALVRGRDGDALCNRRAAFDAGDASVPRGIATHVRNLERGSPATLERNAYDSHRWRIRRRFLEAVERKLEARLRALIDEIRAIIRPHRIRTAYAGHDWRPYGRILHENDGAQNAYLLGWAVLAQHEAHEFCVFWNDVLLSTSSHEHLIDNVILHHRNYALFGVVDNHVHVQVSGCVDDRRWLILLVRYRKRVVRRAVLEHAQTDRDLLCQHSIRFSLQVFHHFAIINPRSIDPRLDDDEHLCTRHTCDAIEPNGNVAPVLWCPCHRNRFPTLPRCKDRRIER